MEAARGGVDSLRDIAKRDDPACVVAAADLEAWERAEGVGSDAVARAIARHDIERLIPGLPARQTYKVLGLAVVAAILVDSALSLLPPSDVVDTLDALVRYGTAIAGLAVAAWSLLSEVRGWTGSDAATWFRKRRIDRTRKRVEGRRRALGTCLIAIGAETLVIYRAQDGCLERGMVTPDMILGLSLEAGSSHMALCLTTSAGTSRFEWLARDAAFEAAAARLANVAQAQDVTVAIV